MIGVWIKPGWTFEDIRSHFKLERLSVARCWQRLDAKWIQGSRQALEEERNGRHKNSRTID